jgi:hypothetical protein
MPYEVVQFAKTAEETDTATSVAVHWDKGSEHVQIKAQRHVWKKPKAADPDPPVEATIFTDGLSRDELNKMIRALRRARDDSFGADA